MWIAGFCGFAALLCYLMMLGAAAGKDWEQEDREQMEYLRGCQEKHKEKRKAKE